MVSTMLQHKLMRRQARLPREFAQDPHILAVVREPMGNAVKNSPVIVPRQSSVPRRCSTMKDAKGKLMVAQKPSANMAIQAASTVFWSSCLLLLVLDISVQAP